MEKLEAGAYIHDDDMAILSRQVIPAQSIRIMFNEMVEELEEDQGGISDNILWLMTRAYSLGVIHGKRIERKGKHKNDFVMDNKCCSLDEIAIATEIMLYCQTAQTVESIEDFTRNKVKGLTKKERENIIELITKAYNETHINKYKSDNSITNRYQVFIKGRQI